MRPESSRNSPARELPDQASTSTGQQGVVRHVDKRNKNLSTTQESLRDAVTREQGNERGKHTKLQATEAYRTSQCSPFVRLACCSTPLTIWVTNSTVVDLIHRLFTLLFTPSWSFMLFSVRSKASPAFNRTLEVQSKGDKAACTILYKRLFYSVRPCRRAEKEGRVLLEAFASVLHSSTAAGTL